MNWHEASSLLSKYISNELPLHTSLSKIYFWQFKKKLAELSRFLVPNGFKAILDGRFPQLTAFSGLSDVQELENINHELSGKLLTSKYAPKTLVKRYLFINYQKNGGKWTIWYYSDHSNVLLVEYIGTLTSGSLLLPIPLPPYDATEVALRALRNKELDNVKVIFGNHSKNLWGHRLSGIGYGWNWLHFVISIQYIDAVKYFITMKPYLIDERSTINNSTPLHQAAYRGNCDIIALLYHYGAKFTTITTPGNYYVAHNACLQGHKEATRFILNFMKEKHYFDMENAPDFKIVKSPSKYVKPNIGIIVEWFGENYPDRINEWGMYLE